MVLKSELLNSYLTTLKQAGKGVELLSSVERAGKLQILMCKVLPTSFPMNNFLSIAANRYPSEEMCEILPTRYITTIVTTSTGYVQVNIV